MTDLTTVHRAIDAALPVVEEHLDEAEQTRRLPGPVVEALRDSGINRLLLPTALGGLKAPVTDLMDVIERLSAVDGSTGWCALIGTGSNIFAGYLPEHGAREVFADPDQSSASVFAPSGRLEPRPAGLRLSGRMGVRQQRPAQPMGLPRGHDCSATAWSTRPSGSPSCRSPTSRSRTPGTRPACGRPAAIT